MKINDIAVMIIYQYDKVSFSLKNDELYEHFKHYNHLYNTDSTFKNALLGYDLNNLKVNFIEKGNDIINLLTVQGNIVFENGNTNKHETDNICIIYLPEADDISEFQIVELIKHIEEYKKLTYLKIYQRTSEQFIDLTYNHQKEGYEVIEDLHKKYYTNLSKKIN